MHTQCAPMLTIWIVAVLIYRWYGQVSFLIDRCKFINIAQTVTAELMYGLHVTGITPLTKLKAFTRIMICSI